MKKRLLFILSLIICLGLSSGCSREVPINERPMFGNIPPTPEVQKAHDEFIKEVIQHGTKEEGAKKLIDVGWKFYREGDLKTAMKRFNQAWLLDPNNADVYFGFGRIMDRKRQIDEAIKMYARAIQINPNLVDAYNNRGLEYFRQGKFKQAINDFTKAIEITPNDAQTYNDRAVSYFKIKEYDKSWEDVHKAIALGYNVQPRFLKSLKKASGREK